MSSIPTNPLQTMIILDSESVARDGIKELRDRLPISSGQFRLFKVKTLDNWQWQVIFDATAHRILA